MSAAKRRDRWQGGDTADSTEVRQGGTNAASGMLIELLSFMARCEHPTYQPALDIITLRNRQAG